MRINLKQNFLQVSFICQVNVWNFRLLKCIDLKSTAMVTSDMQRAADIPSRCCLFNNLCSVYDLLHAKIYYSTSENANKYFFCY